jgi:hypothetical protein
MIAAANITTLQSQHSSTTLTDAILMKAKCLLEMSPSHDYPKSYGNDLMPPKQRIQYIATDSWAFPYPVINLIH